MSRPSVDRPSLVVPLRRAPSGDSPFLASLPPATGRLSYWPRSSMNADNTTPPSKRRGVEAKVFRMAVRR
jgi:hypothetical protein